MTQVLAVVNRKGGSTKTTSSAFLAPFSMSRGIGCCWSMPTPNSRP